MVLTGLSYKKQRWGVYLNELDFKIYALNTCSVICVCSTMQVIQIHDPYNLLCISIHAYTTYSDYFNYVFSELEGIHADLYLLLLTMPK